MSPTRDDTAEKFRRRLARLGGLTKALAITVVLAGLSSTPIVLASMGDHSDVNWAAHVVVLCGALVYLSAATHIYDGIATLVAASLTFCLSAACVAVLPPSAAFSTFLGIALATWKQGAAVITPAPRTLAAHLEWLASVSVCALFSAAIYMAIPGISIFRDWEPFGYSLIAYLVASYLVRHFHGKQLRSWSPLSELLHELREIARITVLAVLTYAGLLFAVALALRVTGAQLDEGAACKLMNSSHVSEAGDSVFGRAVVLKWVYVAANPNAMLAPASGGSRVVFIVWFLAQIGLAGVVFALVADRVQKRRSELVAYRSVVSRELNLTFVIASEHAARWLMCAPSSSVASPSQDLELVISTPGQLLHKAMTSKLNNKPGMWIAFTRCEHTWWIRSTITGRSLVDEGDECARAVSGARREQRVDLESLSAHWRLPEDLRPFWGQDAGSLEHVIDHIDACLDQALAAAFHEGGTDRVNWLATRIGATIYTRLVWVKRRSESSPTGVGDFQESGLEEDLRLLLAYAGLIARRRFTTDQELVNLSFQCAWESLAFAHNGMWQRLIEWAERAWVLLSLSDPFALLNGPTDGPLCAPTSWEPSQSIRNVENLTWSLTAGNKVLGSRDCPWMALKRTRMESSFEVLVSTAYLNLRGRAGRDYYRVAARSSTKLADAAARMIECA